MSSQRYFCNQSCSWLYWLILIFFKENMILYKWPMILNYSLFLPVDFLYFDMNFGIPVYKKLGPSFLPSFNILPSQGFHSAYVVFQVSVYYCGCRGSTRQTVREKAWGSGEAWRWCRPWTGPGAWQRRCCTVTFHIWRRTYRPAETRYMYLYVGVYSTCMLILSAPYFHVTTMFQCFAICAGQVFPIYAVKVNQLWFCHNNKLPEIILIDQDNLSWMPSIWLLHHI